MPERLDEVEHRVLAHLPVWRNPEDAAEAERLERDGHGAEEIAALKAAPANPDDGREGTDLDPRIIAGTGLHITSYTAEQLLERLSHDGPLLEPRPRKDKPGEFLPPLLEELRQTTLTPDYVAGELAGLLGKGLAAVDEQGRWTMTEQGRQALGV